MEIRRCPLCGAGCFDDIDTCYCCMHRFDEDEACGLAQAEELQMEDCAASPTSPAVAGSQVQEKVMYPEGEDNLGSASRCDSREPPDCTRDPEDEGAFEVPIVEAAHWFPAAGEVSAIRDGADTEAGRASLKVFAFGPTVETLPEVGECLRLDIPFSALRHAASVVRASPCAPARSE